jgi:hypothetical protein
MALQELKIYYKQIFTVLVITGTQNIFSKHSKC